MANVSTVLPANVIKTARTAATAAASSTATPYDSGNIITWSLPNTPVTKLVNGSQSFSTQQGQVFTDFASGQIVTPSTDITGSTTAYSIVEGTPANTD
jgi:hypothetical protein